ncbi:MAG: DinB family protein [Fimbriimonadaceae bacterium]|nr:DinB family protein [Fimbriimonadaceae bacterium]
MKNPYVLTLRHTPAILERMLDQIPAGRYAEFRHAERFNLIEAVSHLADWESILLDRMQQTLEHPGSTVEAYDEGERAIAKQYATRDIRHELSVFANRRRDTVSFLETLTPEQLALTSVHPERGVMSIEDQANTMLGHDVYHLEHVSEYFAELVEMVP